MSTAAEEVRRVACCVVAPPRVSCSRGIGQGKTCTCVAGQAAHEELLDRTWFLDGETGEKTEVSKGDKVVIPGKALHAEGEVEEKVVYIVAIPEPVMNRDFLTMRTAESETESLS